MLQKHTKLIEKATPSHIKQKAAIMPFADPKFPSSAAFDDISNVLSSDEAARKEAIQNAKGLFAFTIKQGSETKSWHIDLKSKGTVGEGLGEKPDVVLSLSDADFQKLIDGKAKAQQLFMGGKLKIKGNVMKATKLDPILSKSKSKAKL